MLGKVTDIETMGLVDGPGMRLVIFLAGCKLRCLYCHNPETWDENGHKKLMSSEDILSLYKKYQNYYGETGGVTFSGGEPLIQRDFLIETIKLLKQNNIHVAIDTAGVAEGYEEILDLVDLVILDIKATSPDDYKFITGMEMNKFNEFLKLVQSKNKKLWLRQVIVPGINDKKEQVLKLKEFANQIKNVERIELLPYHTLGVSKYKDLGIEYRLPDVLDMDKEKCKELEKILKKA